jgi:hypothetical protein
LSSPAEFLQRYLPVSGASTVAGRDARPDRLSSG